MIIRDYGDQYVGRWEAYVKKWRTRTFVLGIGLVTSISSLVPFLYGFPLHDRFESIGRLLLFLSMCLLTMFVGSAGLMYNGWSYLRKLRKEGRADGLPSN